jgi:DNA-binding transcriptional LysR family regulator
VPIRSFEVNSTEAIKGLVAAGVGWAVLSARVVRDDLQLGRLKRLEVPDLALRRMLSWIRWKARRLGPAAAAFRSLAEAYTFP